MDFSPPVTTQHIRDLNGQEHQFEGRRLGFGTSRLHTHIHPTNQPPPEGVRCSGCRWSEVRVYSIADGGYVVGIKGHTDVPGEEHRYKCWWSETGEGALACLLITPPRRRSRGVPGEKELPVANRVALQEAARWDDEIDDALLAFEVLEDEAHRNNEAIVPRPAGLTA